MSETKRRGGSVYEVRKPDGTVVCTSNIPRLGYSPDKLKRIILDGYRYYVDGKFQKKVSRE